MQSSGAGRFACEKVRWSIGTSGGWVGKGSVRVLGTMVWTGYGQGVYWSSKAVSVMLEAVAGRATHFKTAKSREKLTTS